MSNLEGVQGREYDVLSYLLSGQFQNLNSEQYTVVDLGLLDDVTQLNTILSRVRGWVIGSG